MSRMTKAERGRGGVETLEQAEALFRRWREGRRRGARIPKVLWASAVAMAERYDVERVAQRLRVDEERLTKHTQRAGGVARTGGGELQFVEVLSGSASAAMRELRECVVELENARGGKMRVELSGQALGTLASLCTAFWGAP